MGATHGARHNTVDALAVPPFVQRGLTVTMIAYQYDDNPDRKGDKKQA
jgi:hypothetical protein